MFYILSLKKISLLPILFLNVLAQDAIPSDDYYRLDTPENIKEFHIVVDIAITLMMLSFCGCFYVFYRTYMQWILNKKRLKMIHRLPFYTACSDFLINTIYFINIIHAAIYAQVWEQPACNIISAINWGFITTNLSLYGVVALSTYTRICHKIYLHRGKWDYKLWLTTIFVSGIFQLINMSNHGACKYWCTGKKGQIVSSLLLFILITVMLLIICVCYFFILRSILAQQDSLKVLNNLNNSNDNNDSEVESINRRRNELEKKAAKKIVSYILVFILQWVPVLVNITSKWIKMHETWNYITALGIVTGGIGNAINYIFNEGWVPRKSVDYVVTVEYTRETLDMNN